MSDRPLFRLTPDGFRPYNDAAQEQVDRCKMGQVVSLNLTLVRNEKYHKLFFAILRLISDNSEPHISPKAALHYAKTAAGVGEFEPTGKGTELRFIPGSISFAKMDQQEFEAFVQASIPPLCARFMNGTAPETVIAEAMALAN